MFSNVQRIAFALYLCSTAALLASEGDPFTQRVCVQTCMPDATCLLNRIANDRLSRALDEVNRKEDGCDRLLLEKTILKFLGNAVVAGIEFPIGPQELEINRGKAKYLRDGLRHQSIPSVKIKKRDSIYQDLTLRESPGTAVSIGSLVRIGDLVISSDKFTHFFAQGYDYIEVYRREQSVQAALHWGLESEKGKKGIEGTGVLAYGDLAANYAGFQFWQGLFDPVCGHVGRCDGKWVQTRCFDWQEHVTPAWDEGINMGCFASGAVHEKICARIQDLVNCGKIPHLPPLDRHKIAELPRYYDEATLTWIVNPVTLSLISVPSELRIVR